MAGQGHTNRRHLTASVAVAGLIFQALMAAVMLPMPLGMRSAQAGAAADAIVICTPSGLKQISFDVNGNPVEKRIPGGGCPVCDALVAAAFALPAVDGATILPVSAPDAEWSAAETFHTTIACQTQNNRGPPALA